MPNKMSFVKKISIFALVNLLFMACSGQVDDTSLPELEVSTDRIELGASIEFKVKYNGEDVTELSEIFLNESEQVGSSYIPAATGNLRFSALYEGKKSAVVTVTVTERQKTESRFERHVSLIEFTGAWCINCPDGYTKMMGVLSKPSMGKYRDRIHICAFHSNREGEDKLAIDATQDVFNLFEGLAYPSFTTDLREAGILTSAGISVLQPSLEASFEEYPAHCGVALSSRLAADGNSAEVTVRVTSELTTEYRVVVLVVEDKIKYKQKTTDYPEGQEDYIHKHVVRKVVTSYGKTFSGEKITDNGIINTGEEESKSWTFGLEDWKLEDTEIYALVLGPDGYVNNMNVCAIDGGEADYNYAN